jgi:lipoate-protein ligase B
MLINIQQLGQIDYGLALKLQKELVARRAVAEIPDTLLLLEHPPTYTVGSEGHRELLLLSDEQLKRLNIAYYEVDRSGGVTYHGPGQLMGYPILNLAQLQCDYHRYIYLLEDVILQVLTGFKIRAFRRRDRRGIWVIANPAADQSSEWNGFKGQLARIGNVGVRVDWRQITSHGFSINVNLELAYFDWIIPGGIEDFNITSIQQLLNRSIEPETVFEAVIQSFCEVFGIYDCVCQKVPTRA